MRLMAIFPHPDDEISTCGTLALHAQRGDAVKFLWLTKGELASHFGDMDNAQVAQIRQQHGQQVAQLIGAEYGFLDFPDSGMLGNKDEAIAIANEIAAWQPDVVFTWDYQDVHPDHRASYWGVLSALKHCRIPKLVGNAHRKPVKLLHYYRSDIPRPAVYVDISPTIEVAEAVFKLYQEFYGWDTTPQTFRANRARLGSEAGVRFAERFQAASPLPLPYLHLAWPEG